MARVRSKNSQPEMIVRRLVHQMGYRYRLHCRDLPGSPDLVFTKRKKAIFVHGCYWHRHDCKRASFPKSNAAFWRKKFDENIARDKRNLCDLQIMGWETMIVWQCETAERSNLSSRLVKFLDVT